jgi:hypothetical protein
VTGPSVRLATDTLRVQPGGQVQTTVTVDNVGDIVQGYRLEVLGAQIGGFATITPDEVQVYPGQQATAVVVFDLPAGTAVVSGTVPFGVRVSSVVDPDGTTVVEGDLEVGAVFGLAVTTVPVTSTGRWSGRHLVTLTHHGNAPVSIRITATDPDDALAFLVLPDRLQLPVGTTASTRVRVRTRTPFLRGSTVRRPFSVSASPDAAEPSAGDADRTTTVTAAFEQRPILSRAVVAVAAAAVLVLGGGLAYAFTRPPTPTGGALATGIPDRPTLTATADGSTITLRWTAQTGLEGYDLFEMLDGARGAVTALPGGQNAAVVEDVPAGTTRCYALQGRRGSSVSPLSAPACATVAAAVAGGPDTATSAPPVTTDPVATAPPGTPPPAGTSPAVTAPAGPPAPPVSSAPSVPVSSVPSEPVSEPEPASGPAAPATPVPPTVEPASVGAPSTTAGTWAAGEHVAVLAVFPAGDADPRGRAEARRIALQPAFPDHPLGLLDSADHPDMTFSGLPVRNDGIFVYAGPFADAAGVAAFCAESSVGGAVCVDAQPGPDR